MELSLRPQADPGPFCSSSHQTETPGDVSPKLALSSLDSSSKPKDSTKWRHHKGKDKHCPKKRNKLPHKCSKKRTAFLPSTPSETLGHRTAESRAHRAHGLVLTVLKATTASKLSVKEAGLIPAPHRDRRKPSPSGLMAPHHKKAIIPKLAPADLSKPKTPASSPPARS